MALTPEKLKEALLKEFPKPRIELNFSNPLELLVATILSAQSTDKKVNEVTKELFKRFKTAEDYAGASEEALLSYIKGINYANQKAKNIIKACKLIVEKHGGQVPKTMEALTELPGVGRKTASVVLAAAFGVPAIAVDTHVLRVSQRLGLTSSKKPEEVEEALKRFLPEKDWIPVNHAMILHGRYICKAKNPDCGHCLLYEDCPWEGKKK
ncbi:MAG: endonuclease III [Nitrospirae bacterium]|nr:MAG: endonuclease III [Nitrospirota bacterium]